MTIVNVVDILALIAALVAFSVSGFVTLISRRSIRRLKRVAKDHASVRAELEKAYADKHFDEAEMRMIISAYNGFLESSSPGYRVSSLINRKARSILRNAANHKNENLFAEIASDVLLERSDSKKAS